MTDFPKLQTGNEAKVVCGADRRTFLQSAAAAAALAGIRAGPKRIPTTSPPFALKSKNATTKP